MSESHEKRAEQLIDNIDKALAHSPALTNGQLQAVRRMRAEIPELCRAGKLDEARRSEELALNIIRAGAPARE